MFTGVKYLRIVSISPNGFRCVTVAVLFIGHPTSEETDDVVQYERLKGPESSTTCLDRDKRIVLLTKQEDENFQKEEKRLIDLGLTIKICSSIKNQNRIFTSHYLFLFLRFRRSFL